MTSRAERTETETHSLTYDIENEVSITGEVGKKIVKDRDVVRKNMASRRSLYVTTKCQNSVETGQ